MVMNSVGQAIKQIGEKMVLCQNSCEGINKDLKKGIIPRCLIFEDKNRSGKQGCLIIGMNPGKGNEEERRHCKENQTYDYWLEFWYSKASNYPYYRRLRSFADQLDLTGPILWSEIGKCSTKTKLPIQTFRVCSSTYLLKEASQIPNNWPIIAVGREAFTATAYMFPNRTVIGIPHVTGSWGGYSKMFVNKILKPEYKLEFGKVKCADSPCLATWLGDIGP